MSDFYYKRCVDGERSLIVENAISALKEDRGVANEVKNLVDDFEFYVVCDSKERKNEFVDVYGGVRRLKGFFMSTLRDVIVDIEWILYDFDNEDLIRKHWEISNKARCEEITKKKFKISFSLKSVNGKINFARSSESLQHEISHAWESSRRGKAYKGMDTYNVANTLISDRYNEYNRYIGNILYFSKSFEVRAYLNGTYRYLINSEDPFLIKKNVEETQLFHAIEAMKVSVFELSKIKDWENHPLTRKTIRQLKEDFKLTQAKILKMGNYAIENMIHAMGRAMAQAEIDIKKKYGLDKPYFERDENGKVKRVFNDLI